jgi:enoyl-CoA hydratase
LTLNRPDQRNALNEEALHTLRRALDGASAAPAVRALVITGAGEKAFCAGADIRTMQAMSVEQGRAWSRLGHEVFRLVEQVPKPVIAAINGIAVGGGCELALACDFRFIAERAQLGQPEIKLGMIPGWGGTQRLPRIVGAALAKDLVLTGRLMTAEEARRVGLVNGIAPDGTALQVALVYAQQFATLPPLAVGYAKLAINQGIELALDEANALEVEQFVHSFATEDKAEGLAAFLEKRAAQFQGR